MYHNFTSVLLQPFIISQYLLFSPNYILLEDMTHYASPLLAPAEGFGQSFGQSFFCPLGKTKAYYAVLANFWRFLVSSRNLGNFYKYPKSF